jgi:hypothetical protein
MLVEYRCPQCGRTTLQAKDSDVLCAPNVKHRKDRSWVRMNEGLIGETQARARNHLVGRKVSAA